MTISQITRIARHFNVQIVDNLLVGFKYVADVLRHIEDSGSFEEVRGTMADFVIATEESHGALVTPDIRDKDSAGAALLMAELMLDLKRNERCWRIIRQTWPGNLATSATTACRFT